MQTQIFDTVGYFFQQTTDALFLFGPVIPQVMGALLAFIIGLVLAKMMRKAVKSVLKSANFSKWISKTPLQLAFEESNVGMQIEEVIANIVYWIVMLLVINTAFTILGLTSLSFIIETIIGYIPKVIIAAFIIFFGILLAGWIEGLVKGAVRTVDLKSSILLGKVSSYVVIVTAILISLSELGIANEFITILFLGFIGSISLGAALAFGLGGKDIVSKILLDWYIRNFDQEILEKKSPKKKVKTQKK